MVPADDPQPGLGAPAWVFAGGAALLLLGVFDVAGPDRSPRSVGIVLGAAALLGGLCVVGYGLRDRLGPALPALAAIGGAVLLALAMGVAPELVHLPMGGIGERIWGLPIALGAPIGGAALLAGTVRGSRGEGVPPGTPLRGSRGEGVPPGTPLSSRVLGGAGCALLIAGLLQPFATVDAVLPAIFHRPNGGSVTLLALAALGVVAVGRPTLSGLAGKLLVGFLPAWSAVRIALAIESGASAAGPVAALLLTAGSSVCLVVGLKAWREAPATVTGGAALSAEIVAVVGLVGAWLLLKAFTWRWSTTDENIYFYDALLISKGGLPYRDFFFAHPPMHIAVPALLFAVFGFSLPLAKAIPVVAALVTAGMCWAMVRERIGRLAAFVALGSFLFAFELLQASTNMNGVCLTSMWLTAGLFFLLRDRPIAAGLVLGMAVTTGFYAIAGALALLVLAFFRSARVGARQLGAFVLVAGLINLVFYGIGGDAYIDSVYRFHLLKAPRAKLPAFIRMLYHHTPLFAGLLLAPVLVAWQQLRGVAHVGEETQAEDPRWFFSPLKIFAERGVGLVKIAWLVCVALLIELTRFRELYSFYFVLLFPFAAICTGYVVSAIVSAIVHELGELGAGRARWLSLAAPAFAIAFGLWVPLAAEARWVFSAKGGTGANPEFLQRGERRDYRWIEPAALKSVAGPVTRALFWRDHRIRWEMEPGYRHFLWQKSLHLSVADAIGDYVRENSAEDETVAGGSLIAPAVALVSGRRLAADVVDTNAKRFKTGIYTVQAWFESICADRIRFLVTSPSGYVSDRLLSRLPAAKEYFRPVKRFEDPWNKFLRPDRRLWAVTLWEIRDAGTDGPRCAWIDPRRP